MLTLVPSLLIYFVLSLFCSFISSHKSKHIPFCLGKSTNISIAHTRVTTPCPHTTQMINTRLLCTLEPFTMLHVNPI